MRHGMFTNDELQMKNVGTYFSEIEAEKKRWLFSPIVYPAIIQ